MSTAYHSQFWAHSLTLRGSGGNIEALSRSIANARVDLTDAPAEMQDGSRRDAEDVEGGRRRGGRGIRKFGKGKAAGPTLFDMARNGSKGGGK